MGPFFAALILLFPLYSFAHPFAKEWALKSWPMTEVVKSEVPANQSASTHEQELQELLPKFRSKNGVFASFPDFLKKIESAGLPVDFQQRGPSEKDAQASALKVGLDWGAAEISRQHQAGGTSYAGSSEVFGEFDADILPARALVWNEIFWVPWDYREPFTTVHFPKHKTAVGGALDQFDLFWGLAIQAKALKKDWIAQVFLGRSLYALADLSHPFHCSQFGSLALMPWAAYIKGPKFFHRKAARLHYAMGKVFEDAIHDMLTRGSSTTAGQLLAGSFQVPKPTPLFSSALSNTEISASVLAYALARASTRLAPQILAPLWSLWGERIESLDQDFPEAIVTQADFDELNSTIVKTKVRNRELLTDAFVENVSNFVAAVTWLQQRWKNTGP